MTPLSKSPFIHWNYVCMSYHLRYSASKNGVTFKMGVGVVQGHWKWRRSIDHIRLTIGRPFVSMLYHFQVICRWIIVIRDLEKGHLSSFKLVPHESLGAVTCSPSTVTMAISLTIMRYSASNYSVTLKTGLRVVQVHWKWRHSIDHVRLSIGPPL